MQVCLISPPTVTDFEDPAVAEDEAIRLIEEHAPVGILSLAAVLEEQGTISEIVDLNRLYYRYLRSEEYHQPDIDFCKFVVGGFESLSFDIFGFSTICSSYPLTLRIAREIKRTHPNATIILGGPQATVVDVHTLTAFPFIDLIVRGEAEETLPLLLDAISSRNTYEAIPGITFRRGTDIVRNINAAVIDDLDRLPMPAFHLYPELKECHYVPLELGRGCPFACSFCSTNDFFRRNFRVKSPQRLIEQMRMIKETYGIATFDLIHDMFTVDRKKVAAFCEALLEAGEKFSWNCSARTDCVDDELIALMAKAGCRGIFFGIETGSSRMQKIVNKGLDLSDAMLRIKCNNKHRIKTAVSLITGFPEETKEDLRDTVSFLIDSLRFDYAQPQFHLLAPLAETPIHAQYRDKLIFDDIISDMSYQGWRQDPADRAMINSYPEIFPNFYAVPTPWLDRQFLKELRDFVLNGMQKLRWLFVGLHQHSGDLLKVFEDWREWRLQRPESGSDSDTDLSQYYSGIEFPKDLLEFVRSRYLSEPKKGDFALLALLDYESAFAAVVKGSSSAPDGSDADSTQSPKSLGLETIPSLAKDVSVARLDADYKKIIRCLKRKGRLDRVPEHPVILVTRGSVEVRGEVLQLSRLSAQLLRLCDGTRTVKEIAELFSSLGEDVDGIPADKACKFGLEMLRLQRLITVSPEPAAANAISTS
jgi:radical SAM superfamily enzyme YgiQ (UPF0313 family)